MITPDRITEATTLADLARLLNAFGLMLTCKPVDRVAYEATCSDRGDEDPSEPPRWNLVIEPREPATPFYPLDHAVFSFKVST